MIFTVDIGGNRPTDTDVLGPRRDGKKKSTRNRAIEDIREAGRGTTLKDARFRVEVEHRIQARLEDDAPGLIERRIAIAPSFAPRNQIRLGCAVYDLLKFFQVLGSVEIAYLDRILAPARQLGRYEGRAIYHVAAAAMMISAKMPAT